MATKKLTPALQREIIEKGAEGSSARQIAAWLQSAHKLKVSHQAVGNILRSTRAERGNAVKEIVREKLAPMVCSDIDRLEDIRTELSGVRALARRAITKAAEGKRRRARGGDSDDEGEQSAEGATWARQYAKLTELEIKCLDRKLHYSGADAEEAGAGAQPAVHVFLPAEKEE